MNGPRLSAIVWRRVGVALLSALLIVAVWLLGTSTEPAVAEGFEQLHATIKPQANQGIWGDGRPFCSDIKFCGVYVEIVCHPEVDGPVKYFNNTSGILIMNCGGACMRGRGAVGSTTCAICPPPEWSCAAPRFRSTLV
jgi:hypothetical protein